MGLSVHFAKCPILRFYDFSTSPTIFIGSHPNFYAIQTFLTMGKCRLLLYLAIGQVLQSLWHFEILTLESTGEPKMWNISKTTDCRAKRILDRRAKEKLWHFEFFLTQDHMQLEISRCYFSHNFHWIHPNFMTTLVTMINLNAS